MKILSFGHIPSWAGGKQESGLANVIYQLAKHESEIEESNVVLAATDCAVPYKIDGKLTIIGWTTIGLLSYIIKHPHRSFNSLKKLMALKKRYPFRESLLGLYLKRIFLDKTIKVVRPHILHLHGPSAIWYLDLAPSETKIVVTLHGMTGLDKNVEQSDVLYYMEHDVFHSPEVKAYFFICTQLVTLFKTTYGDNNKDNNVIFNAYDSTSFYYEEGVLPSKNPQKITLCTVASLSNLKGQFRVLRVLAGIPNRDRFQYFCIGNDSEGLASRMIEFARENSIEFYYLGKKKPDQIRWELVNADYMIMPSSSEGFGISYLEAIACGVPVILPKDIPIAGEKNLINNNNSILLENSTERAICKVLSQIDVYHFERKVVAESLKDCSWNSIAKQYISVFNTL